MTRFPRSTKQLPLDYMEAKESCNTLQTTVGDKMTVTLEEFDEIFSLVCQDPIEHFELFGSYKAGKVVVVEFFAVIIVYCEAIVEEKAPLLFDLFDFDHSKEIFQDELVLLNFIRHGISLDECSKWAMDEKSVMVYLAKCTNTRMVYDNQIQCALMLKEIYTTFVNFAQHKKSKNGQRALFCPVDVYEEIIQRHCSTTE
ncbi:hypothetical protein BBO99_00008916 [Phytophthora kernoviae]|uniref:Uncharacterized protein n=2 Tax=Phytophthora kernoviae TaxID=325452 RepID=A0A421GDS8_9STRA|nr:hypothetical protein G195_010214 [Phytophthora kernoviae 00238/432]KAG2508706.1 hypothetical protein JM16_008743 [Phytophthora kernoviae]KAG2510863.1 hypothetical protein JM18_008537 [Phytophthora kernoviae]RLN37001.1 hypothetical protein BBI17_008935 [Phytophthora kernoviae]RLN74524.1 hypothetical protein BBO99_00008916 [Phytophthora kernoviae]